MKLTSLGQFRSLIAIRHLQLESGRVWRCADPDYDHYSTIRARGVSGLGAQG